MEIVTESKIDGTFTGWSDDSYYTLVNGQVWQQVHSKYGYHYAYRPTARVLRDGAKYFLQVDGVNEMVEVRPAPSTNFLYNSFGQAVGFWHRGYVYDLNGRPIGQINGTHVHKLSGKYVGELYKDMVVDKRIGDLRSIGNSGVPGKMECPSNPGNRGAVNYGFPDVFGKLLE